MNPASSQDGATATLSAWSSGVSSGCWPALVIVGVGVGRIEAELVVLFGVAVGVVVGAAVGPWADDTSGSEGLSAAVVTGPVRVRGVLLGWCRGRSARAEVLDGLSGIRRVQPMSIWSGSVSLRPSGCSIAREALAILGQAEASPRCSSAISLSVSPRVTVYSVNVPDFGAAGVP